MIGMRSQLGRENIGLRTALNIPRTTATGKPAFSVAVTMKWNLLHAVVRKTISGVTAVKTAVMGNGFSFYRGSCGVIGDSCLEISIEYRGRTGRGNRCKEDNFSSITAVAAVMGTKRCVRGGNGDDFFVLVQLSTANAFIFLVNSKLKLTSGLAAGQRTRLPLLFLEGV